MDGTAAIDRLLAIAGVGHRDTAEEAHETAPYVCQGCGVKYEVQYHVCPKCDGFSVEPRTAAALGDCESGGRTDESTDRPSE